MAQRAYAPNWVAEQNPRTYAITIQIPGSYKRDRARWERQAHQFVGRRACNYYWIAAASDNYAEFQLRDRVEMGIDGPTMTRAVGCNRTDALRKWKKRYPDMEATIGKLIYKTYRTLLPSMTTPDCPAAVREVGAKRICVYEIGS